MSEFEVGITQYNYTELSVEPDDITGIFAAS